MLATRTTRILLPLLLLIVGGGIIWFFLYKEKNENPVSGLKPRVEMGVGRINAFTDSTIDLTLDLMIHNPLPMEFDVREFGYLVKMDGTTVVENDYPESVTVRSRDSTVITLPSRLKIKKLTEINKLAPADSDSADYEFVALLGLKNPILGQDTLRLTQKRRLPRYQLPSVQVVGFDLDKFRLDQSKVVIQLSFKNNNAFPLEFKNPTYSIDLGSQTALARGGTEGITKVKGQSQEMYEVPLTISMGDLLKASGEMLFQGQSLPFTLHFSCTLASQNEMFSNSDVRLIIEGQMKDLKKIKENMSD